MRVFGPYPLDGSNLTDGQTVTDTIGGPPDNAALVVRNESPFTLYFTLPGSGHAAVDLAPGCWERLDTGSTAWDGTFTATAKRELTGASGSAQSASFTIRSYRSGEPCDVPYGAMSLVRFVNVGGGTVGATGVSAINNDGNPAPTQVVEATPLGSGVSELLLYNDGSATLGGGNLKISNAGVFTTMPADAIPTAALAAGALDTDVTLGAAQLTAGAIPAGVTLPAGQVSAGTLASGVHLTSINSDSGVVVSNGTGNLTAANLIATTGGAVRLGDTSHFVSASGQGGAFSNLNIENIDAAGNGRVNVLVDDALYVRNTANTIEHTLAATGKYTAAGAIAGVGGQATAGSFGVPLIVAQAINTHVTATTTQTILSFTIPATGLYRVNAFASIGGTGTSTLTAGYAFQDPNIGGASSDNFVHILGAVSGFSFPRLNSLEMTPVTLYCNNASTLSVTFQDSAASPSDWVTVIVERLS